MSRKTIWWYKSKSVKNSGKAGNTVYYPVGQKPEYVETRMGQIK